MAGFYTRHWTVGIRQKSAIGQLVGLSALRCGTCSSKDWCAGRWVRLSKFSRLRPWKSSSATIWHVPTRRLPWHRAIWFSRSPSVGASGLARVFCDEVDGGRVAGRALDLGEKTRNWDCALPYLERGGRQMRAPVKYSAGNQDEELVAATKAAESEDRKEGIFKRGANFWFLPHVPCIKKGRRAFLTRFA